MVNKWRDTRRNSKNMKKVHKIALRSVTRNLTQGSALSALVVCFRCSTIVVVLASVGWILIWLIHSISSLQLKKRISWLSAYYSYFYIYYWRSRKWKILEKSQITATYTHCIIYKFQLNPFTTVQEMDFLIINLKDLMG